MPGAFTSNKGEDFRRVLEETARIKDKDAAIPRPAGRWSTSGCILGGGWSVAWRVHDAQFWGTPQRRKRIALVADFRGQAAPEILFERKGVSRDTPESGEARQGVAADIKRCSDSAGTIVYGISAYESNSMKSANPYSGVYEADTTRTLDLNGCLPVCNQGGMVVVFDARGNGTGKIVPTITGDHESRITDYTALYVDHSVARRLTPLECERLQGYPDNWTNIGEWIDSKGRKRKCADTPRYKALGNSIALPFWEWLAKRIHPYLGENPTMGSLFDGIGGFPLVFSRAGIKPMWASEIEEFPVAVTKKRFGECKN